MRQFYDEPRTFRITNKISDNGYQFVEFNNKGLREQQTGMSQSGEMLFRKPIFDIDVKAQKKSPFSIMSQNELAKELLEMGAFNPERAQEMLGAMMLMEFEGKEEVEEFIKQGQTLFNICQQQAQELAMLKAAVMGVMPQGTQGKASGGAGGNPPAIPSSPVTDGVMQAQSPRAPYAEALAKRSTPSL